MLKRAAERGAWIEAMWNRLGANGRACRIAEPSVLASWRRWLRRWSAGRHHVQRYLHLCATVGRGLALDALDQWMAFTEVESIINLKLDLSTQRVMMSRAARWLRTWRHWVHLQEQRQLLSQSGARRLLLTKHKQLCEAMSRLQQYSRSHFWLVQAGRVQRLKRRRWDLGAVLSRLRQHAKLTHFAVKRSQIMQRAMKLDGLSQLRRFAAMHRHLSLVRAVRRSIDLLHRWKDNAKIAEWEGTLQSTSWSRYRMKAMHLWLEVWCVHHTTTVNDFWRLRSTMADVFQLQRVLSCGKVMRRWRSSVMLTWSRRALILPIFTLWQRISRQRVIAAGLHLISSAHSYHGIIQRYLSTWRAMLLQSSVRLTAYAWLAARQRRRQYSQAFGRLSRYAAAPFAELIITHRRKERRKSSALSEWRTSSLVEKAFDDQTSALVVEYCEHLL